MTSPNSLEALTDHLEIAEQCRRCNAPTFRRLHLARAAEIADSHGLHDAAARIRDII